MGSPGSANPICPVYTTVDNLQVGDSVISEVMIDTSATADYVVNGLNCTTIQRTISH